TRAAIDTVIQGLAETRALADSNTQGLAETRAIVNSNARAIEAATESISTLGSDIREGFAQTRAELQQEVQDVVSMIGSLSEEVEQTQEAAKAASQAVDRFITESKQQRDINTEEHTDFRTAMYSMLAELTRILRLLRSA
ncbi:MAG: hypothetical protein AAFQ89_02005, partial [Cyanobacteria bacterium J06626_18]